MSNVKTCCGPTCCSDGETRRSKETGASFVNQERNVLAAVQSKYGSVAASELSSRHDGVRAVAEAFGYTPEELASIPAEANMGLSCGNPTATASLKLGEVVVDLGSGGGLDVFLASRKVGPTGKAIGIDMTPEMIERAQRGAAIADNGRPLTNVEFHLATIDKLPLPNASADCVISNCVINLAPDKNAVFREIARVLRPGGRLAASDIALKKPLPPEIGNDLLAYVGCIAGAIPIEQYRQGLLDTGFSEVQIIDSGADLNAYAKVENQSGCCSPPAGSPSPAGTASTNCCAPSPTGAALPVVAAESCCAPPAQDGTLHERLADLLKRYDINDYAASVKVFALKHRQ